jgi:hypothetical protein
MEEKDHVYETLGALTQDVTRALRSVEVLKTYLIVHSPEPDKTAELFTSAEGILEKADPNREKFEQHAAIFALLKTGKKPDAPDA